MSKSNKQGDDEACSEATEATFRYVVNNFSKLKGSQLSSPCYIRNLPWNIMVMPRLSPMVNGTQQKNLACFLQCNRESESSTWSCNANADFKLIAQKEGRGITTFSRSIQHLFNSKEDDWGFSDFLAWNYVLNPVKGYIKDDTIILEEPSEPQFFAHTKRLHRILECPVCLEVVKAPFQHCNHGHLTCSACVSKMKVKICSLCEQPFRVENSAVITSLLDILPQFCHFADNGCKRVSDSGDVLEHELYCSFKTITCGHSDCEQVLPLSQLQTHYKDEHPTDYRLTKLKDSIYWYNFDPEEDRRAVVPIFVYGQVFLLHLNNDSATSELKLTLKVFLLKKPEGDQWLTIKFEKDDVSFSKTIKAVVMKEDGVSKESDTPDTTDDDSFMTVPQRFLPRFMDKNQKLQCSYSFLTL